MDGANNSEIIEDRGEDENSFPLFLFYSKIDIVGDFDVSLYYSINIMWMINLVNMNIGLILYF